MKILVLASTSQRRIELLKKLGIEFIVIPPSVSEIMREDPVETVLLNARNKALNVISKSPEGSVIVAADTVIYSREIGVIGKPSTLIEAEEILGKLRGKWHSVYTGVYIVEKVTLRYTRFVEETRVKFRMFSEDELRKYLSSLEPLGKAGGYAIQGLGLFLVETIVGDFYNVVGIPLQRLYIELRKFGIDLLGEAVRRIAIRKSEPV